MKFFIVSLMLSLMMCLGAHSAQAEAPAGWEEIAPGGDTLCGRGEPFSFLVHRGDPNKIALQFGGGGACWNTMTCDNDTVFHSDVNYSFQQIADHQGAFDLDNDKNPYKGWTQIFIPYCTGDLHLGNADKTYTRMDDSTFVIHHRGAVNARAVLDWMKANIQSPQQMTVAGCSAGSYGSVVWTPHLAELYKTTQLVQLGDSGAGVSDQLFFPEWNMAGAIAPWIPGFDPKTVQWDKLTIVDVYKNTAGYYPQIQFSEFNHSNDRIQSLFYVALGGNYFDWSSEMFKIMKNQSSIPNFHYYVAQGGGHCLMHKSDLYNTESDGVQLQDWMSQFLTRAPLTNVTCKECGDGHLTAPQSVPLSPLRDDDI